MKFSRVYPEPKGKKPPFHLPEAAGFRNPCQDPVCGLQLCCRTSSPSCVCLTLPAGGSQTSCLTGGSMLSWGNTSQTPWLSAQAPLLSSLLSSPLCQEAAVHRDQNLMPKEQFLPCCSWPHRQGPGPPLDYLCSLHIFFILWTSAHFLANILHIPSFVSNTVQFYSFWNRYILHIFKRFFIYFIVKSSILYL